MTQHAALPTGTVTFVFTDIEGSTRLWEAHPQAMEAALRRHDEILREAFESHGGYVFKTVGDAFYGAFPTTAQGIVAALQAQRQLSAEVWPPGIDTLRVRMAIHTGSADERGGDYFGPPLNKVARLLSAGHGGQVLLTAVAAELSRGQLPPTVTLVDLGQYRLKDLTEPETVYQLAGDELAPTFPPLRTGEAGRHHLPLQMTTLIGRRSQVEELTALLGDPDVRLVTLTGVGGTGKTRLALQVATDMADRFEHGAHFVDLSAVADLNGVARATIETLEIAERGQEEPQAVLQNYLSSRHLLLVLDNYEQAITAAFLVSNLLSVAPRLQVLVTSRELLRVSGEQEYPVPPLALPTSRDGRLPDELLAYEAIALFVDRAQLVNRDFRLSPENADAVVAICARLDGLPLAIELAAARIRMFTPQVLLTRLDERLNTLRTGLRDVPERQQTLRGAIDWSFNLLDESEQRLFRRLAVFYSGFSIEAVEAICGPGLQMDALDGLEQLLNKSLIRRSEGNHDQARFAMLETIGEYARERLQLSDEGQEMRDRHAAYFYEMTATLGANLRTHQQLEWFNRLDPERDNLRASLRYYLDGADIDRGVSMAAAMNEYWIYSYQYNEAKEWLDRAIALRAHAALPAQVDVLTAGGLLAAYRHSVDEGRRMLAEALELAIGLDDPIRQAWSRIWWAVNAYRSDSAESRQQALQGLEIFRTIGYGPGITQSLNVYGESLRAAGELNEAGGIYKELIALALEIGDYRRVAMQYANLGIIAYVQDDAPAMLRYARLGFPVAITYHVEEVATLLLLLVGQVAARQGQGELAMLLAGAATAWYADMSVAPQLNDIDVENRLTEDIRQSVDESTFEEGRRRGARLGLLSAVALAEKEIAQLEMAITP